MTTRYPKDNDWGDWMHEQRKQKALDKRWDEELDRAMATTYRDATETCQRCGRKGVPPCKCHDGEQPEYRPDTAFGV